uniref:MARVEL domain-containing protein n=1 Tax=Caenorhabditis tropicalis TaxID=1561998 RepID=A0A1I7UXS8_9PELO
MNSIFPGMSLLASVEFAFCAITGSITMYNIIHQKPEDLTAFEVCLVGLMLFFGLTCIMLIIGVQKHAHQLIYPSLLARGLTTLFLAVFGVSTVFSSSKNANTPIDYKEWENKQKHSHDEPNMALRLVLFVFAMLFLTVIIFYCSYLVVRLIHYEQAYARLKERRSSLIQAGMIDPDYPSPNNYSASRRASSA